MPEFTKEIADSLLAFTEKMEGFCGESRNLFYSTVQCIEDLRDRVSKLEQKLAERESVEAGEM